VNRRPPAAMLAIRSYLPKDRSPGSTAVPTLLWFLLDDPASAPLPCHNLLPSELLPLPYFWRPADSLRCQSWSTSWSSETAPVDLPGPPYLPARKTGRPGEARDPWPAAQRAPRPVWEQSGQPSAARATDQTPARKRSHRLQCSRPGNHNLDEAPDASRHASETSAGGERRRPASFPGIQARIPARSLPERGLVELKIYRRPSHRATNRFAGLLTDR
jgi:hypothetical protein